MSVSNKLPKNFKLLMALLTKTGLQGRRHAIVWDYSNGRTESSKELTDPETNRIIHDLEKGFKELDRSDIMRKKIISQAHEMAWELPGHKADMARINDWCVKFGYLHKPLNQYKYTELPALVTQFDSVYRSFLKAI
jgi:hypothetical protein